MLNGWLQTQNYAHGVIKLFKDLQGVIIWLVYAEKAFVICAVNHGNLIIRIILNAIYLRRVTKRILIEKKRF